MEIPQLVEIIKKCGLSIETEIKNIMKMAHRNGISSDVVNKIPIREYGRNKRDQTSKYTILKNGGFYVHHDCYKNQKVRGKVEVPCPWYGHEGCGFKLVMQNFTYNLLLKNRGGMLRLTSL